jgi:hypothetical protein
LRASSRARSTSSARPTPTSASSPGPISPTTSPSTRTAAVATLLTTARTGSSWSAAPGGRERVVVRPGSATLDRRRVHRQEMVHMGTELRTSVEIRSTAERVWQVLTDLAAYPEWNPFIVAADGPVVVGQRLSLTMQPVGGRRVTVRPTVLEVVPGRRLRWLGRLGIGGLFDAEHAFEIGELGAGGVRLSQEERFRGLLVPLATRSLARSTLPAFHAMNRALKDRAERAPAPRPG